MDTSQYTKEEQFISKLVSDIRNDIYIRDYTAESKILTLQKHLLNNNNSLGNYYTPDELLDVEQNLKNAVKDITNLDIDEFLCSGIVVLAEYLSQPDEMLYYSRNNYES